MTEPMYYSVGGKPIYHGTAAGHTAHYQALNPDNDPCEECREAAYKAHKAALKRKVAQGSDSLLIDALGTRRRIRALQRLGWTNQLIGEATGMNWALPDRSVKRLMYTTKVSAETARAIDRAYRLLENRRGPSRPVERRAIAKGWAPPGAWDDIDDPDCEPQGMTKKEIAA